MRKAINNVLKLHACLLVIVTATTLNAQLSQTHGPGAASQITVGGQAQWYNINRILAHDGSTADATVTCRPGYNCQGTSYYLVASGFGFNIPSNATVLGIQVDIYKYAQNGVSDLVVELPASVNRASSSVWPLTETLTSYGGSNDTWGRSWTPSDINASSFGVSLRVMGHNQQLDNIAHVDYIDITVYYSVP